MAKILAPNRQYTGISASIAFANGVGETSTPHLISWFKEHGYQVEGDEDQQENNQGTDNTDNDKPLEKMDKKELESVADEMMLEHDSKTTKEQFIAMIKEAKEQEE